MGIIQNWEWMTYDKARRLEANGLTVPEGCTHVVNQQKPLDSLLIGVETSAPYKESFFGNKHTCQATVNTISAFGGQKWSAYRNAGEEVPADGWHAVDCEHREVWAVAECVK